MRTLKPSLKAIVAGLAIVAGAFFFQARERPAVFKRPHIILWSADTLRADHLSCYGYFRKTSPNIDAFAKDSVLFRNAITQAPSTTPAHMSIFTALTPLVHLCQPGPDNGEADPVPRLDEKIKTLPQMLKENGYLTRGLVGGGRVDGIFGFDKGFDSYSVSEWGFNDIGDVFDDARKDLLKTREKGEPLFLFLHNFICHAPYCRSPPDFRRRFLSQSVAGLPMPEDSVKIKADGVSAEVFWKNVDLNDAKQREHIVSLYDGGIAYEDYLFGKFLEILKKEKLYDNSIIIFLSDHGEEFNEHGNREHGWLAIEDLHVPLIIKFPESTFGGRTVLEKVRTMDLLPTLFDLLGVKIRHEIQGVSFAPLITGKGVYAPIIVSYSAGPGGKGIRFLQDPFVYSNEPRKGTKEWLFDAVKDPSEKNNLAGKHPEIVRRMNRTAQKIVAENESIREKIDSRPTNVWLPKDDKRLSQLRALGYLQ